jgi:hypothetical protein
MFLAKQRHQYQDHREAARHCASAAKEHRKAHDAHSDAENRHEEHAMDCETVYAADICNKLARQHRIMANEHLGHADVYTTLSRSHRAAALDGPSHLSLRFAYRSSQRAQQSHEAAQISCTRAQNS